MTERRRAGIAASDGIALGPALRYTLPRLDLPARQPEAPERELALFVTARETARAEPAALRGRVAQRSGSDEEAAIFDAHQLMLADPLFADRVRQGVERGATVEPAAVKATRALADMLAGLQDELFAARALDIQDVGRRVLRILLGRPDTTLAGPTEPSIVLAQDLTPSDTASLDPAAGRG
jgi:phosphoenolpyruvate-protein kinase (PTS system EI component)